MASDDHNEEFDELTVNNVLVDPSGTQHTGELADIADTGSGSGTVASVSDDGTLILEDPTDLNFGEFLEVVTDNDGTVTISGVNTDTNTHATVENDDGTTLVKNVSAIQAGNNLSFSDDGDGSATLDYTGSGLKSGAPAFIAGDQQYEHIKVGAGEEFNEDHPAFDLSEGGVWENKLIDLTADGAEMCVLVFFDNWTIRNVAVVGVNESSTGHGTWWVRAGGDGGTGDETGRMENIWLGHGDGGGRRDWPSGRESTGIFVDRNHIGTLTLDGIYCEQWSDNAIYASGPGTSEGNGGEVHIKNSYGARCSQSTFRLGTDGSSFSNCVVDGAWSDAFVVREGGTVDADSCSASGHKLYGFKVYSGSTLNLNDTNGENHNHAEPTNSIKRDGTVNGSVGERPQARPPAGCPQTPNEALTGIREDGWNS